MQGGQPVHYASRAMMEAKNNYGQREKALLAICFACGKFQPPGQCYSKTSCMLLRLQCYDLDIRYMSGKLM